MSAVKVAASKVPQSEVPTSLLSSGDQALKAGQTAQAIGAYCQFLLTPSDDETILREKETLLMRVAKLFEQ